MNSCHLFSEQYLNQTFHGNSNNHLRATGKISIDLPTMYHSRKIKIILYYIILLHYMVKIIDSWLKVNRLYVRFDLPWKYETVVINRCLDRRMGWTNRMTKETTITIWLNYEEVVNNSNVSDYMTSFVVILYKIYSCVVLYKMFTLLQIKYTFIVKTRLQISETMVQVRKGEVLCLPSVTGF